MMHMKLARLAARLAVLGHGLRRFHPAVAGAAANLFLLPRRHADLIAVFPTAQHRWRFQYAAAEPFLDE
jgi:hypothetical protein